MFPRLEFQLIQRSKQMRFDLFRLSNIAKSHHAMISLRLVQEYVHYVNNDQNGQIWLTNCGHTTLNALWYKNPWRIHFSATFQVENYESCISKIAMILSGITLMWYQIIEMMDSFKEIIQSCFLMDQVLLIFNQIMKSDVLMDTTNIHSDRTNSAEINSI